MGYVLFNVSSDLLPFFFSIGPNFLLKGSYLANEAFCTDFFSVLAGYNFVGGFKSFKGSGLVLTLKRALDFYRRRFLSSLLRPSIFSIALFRSCCFSIS
jgi:hypothetical protein